MAKSETRPRLLIADDDEGTVEIFRIFLARDGFDVDEALDGDDAYACITGKKYDAILLDLRMPGMTGFEILRTIRDTSPILLKRIIVISAMPESGFAGPVYDGETFARFRKPGDLMEIRNSIRKCAEAAGARIPPRRARSIRTGRPQMGLPRQT